MAYTAGQKLRASQLSVYVCTSSTRPDGHSGQLIYETDTGTLAVYTGSTWKYITTTGEVSHYFESNQTGSGQTIGTGSDTLVSFDTNNVTTTLATKAASSPGHRWTVNRAGLWSLYTTIRWDSAVTGSMRLCAIRKNGNHVASSNVHLSHSNVVNNHCSVTLPLAVNDIVDVVVFQDAGADRTMDPSNTLGWCRFGGAWIRS